MAKLAEQQSRWTESAAPGEAGSARLAAIAQANLADAQVWRWFSDGMEDGRLRVTRQQANWVIVIDGHAEGVNESLDAAVRDVYEKIGTLAPASNSWSRFSGSFMWQMEGDDSLGDNS